MSALPKLSTFMLASMISAVHAQSTICDALSSLYEGQVSASTSSAFNYTNTEFWDQRCSLEPQCMFYPTTAEEVSTGLQLLVSQNVSFAVKGGGHLTNPGFNNIDGGVLIAMERMDTLEWDDTVLQAGPGLLWGAVYNETEKKNRVALGGRIPIVGVPGLLLGGGLSYLQNEYGFACDNVVGYEIVLANGTITNVTASQHSDLFKALKGGGSNFGLVTRFDLATYPMNGSWGGRVTVPIGDANTTTNSSIISTLANFALANGEDKKSTILPGITTIPSYGIKTFAASLFYAEPLAGNTTPPVFDEVLALGGEQHLGAMTISEVAQLTATGAVEGSGRNTFRAASLVATEESIRKVDEIFHQYYAEIADVTGLATNLEIQPISKAFILAGNGTANVMGLDASRAPYIWISQGIRWSNADDDEKVMSTQKKITDAYMAWAEEAGLADSFVYMNDADGSQDIFASYGQENHEFLRQVKQRYDPDGVFTKLMPGGYKV